MLASDLGESVDKINFAWVLFNTEMDDKVLISKIVATFSDKEDFLNGFDSDKDGSLTYAEFKKALESDKEIVELLLGKLTGKLGMSLDSVKAMRKPEVVAVEAEENLENRLHREDSLVLSSNDIKVEIRRSMSVSK